MNFGNLLMLFITFADLKCRDAKLNDDKIIGAAV